MQTEKVGMKDLDRRLGEILAIAQKVPVIVCRWRVPWLCIVPDVVWDQTNPWGSLLPPDHPLVMLRSNLDARLRHEPELLSSIGSPNNSLFPAAVLMRILALRVLRDIRCEDYLRDQINFNMLHRWFVGLPMECDYVEEIVCLAWQLGRRPGMDVSVASLMAGLSVPSFAKPKVVLQQTLFGNECPQHFAA